MGQPKTMILDTDPGYDDAVALLLACGASALRVVGITAVAGNASVEKTFENARRLVGFLRMNIPVARGCDRPLVRKLITAPQVHGETGLDGVELPPAPWVGEERHAVQFLIDTVRGAEGPMELVTLGPLTNVALALRLAPDIRERITRIVMMGGSTSGGNITPAAEFNIYVDPEAAQIVFEAGVSITMVGLDVTNRAVFTQEDVTVLEGRGPASRLAARILTEYMRRTRRPGRPEGARMHDPLAVAVAVDPTLVRTESLRVEVETAGARTVGQTVVDLHRVGPEPPNADVALDVDLPRFKEFVFETLKALDAHLG